MDFYGWTQVAIICGEKDTFTTYFACKGTQKLFEDSGIKVNTVYRQQTIIVQVNQWATMNATSTINEIDEILEETKKSARIIIVPTDVACFGAELALLQRATALNMLNGLSLSTINHK